MGLEGGSLLTELLHSRMHPAARPCAPVLYRRPRRAAAIEWPGSAGRRRVRVMVVIARREAPPVIATAVGPKQSPHTLLWYDTYDGTVSRAGTAKQTDGPRRG